MTTTSVSLRTSNRRLLKLATFLRTVPPKRFSYSTWVGWDWEGAPDLSCGTTACALGWATTMPEFRRLGLRLVESDWGGEVILHTRHVSDFNAAAKLFGLSEDEALYLFAPVDGEYGATPKRVARKIERFVETRGQKQ